MQAETLEVQGPNEPPGGFLPMRITEKGRSLLQPRECGHNGGMWWGAGRGRWRAGWRSRGEGRPLLRGGSITGASQGTELCEHRFLVLKEKKRL